MPTSGLISHLDQFAGRAPFSAWLTRIAVHEALGRLRLRKRNPQLDDTEDDGELRMDIVETSPDPEQNASTAELGHLLEEALLARPEKYRTVVMLRDVEELSTSETAAALDLSEENAKKRLHRGHEMARGWLFSRVGTNAKTAFRFMGARCDRVVQSVFESLAHGACLFSAYLLYNHKGLRLHREQVVFRHDPHHSLVIYSHTATP